MPFLNTAVLSGFNDRIFLKYLVLATDNMRHLMTCDAI